MSTLEKKTIVFFQGWKEQFVLVVTFITNHNIVFWINILGCKYKLLLSLISFVCAYVRWLFQFVCRFKIKEYVMFEHPIQILEIISPIQTQKEHVYVWRDLLWWGAIVKGKFNVVHWTTNSHRNWYKQHESGAPFLIPIVGITTMVTQSLKDCQTIKKERNPVTYHGDTIFGTLSNHQEEKNWVVISKFSSKISLCKNGLIFYCLCFDSE